MKQKLGGWFVILLAAVFFLLPTGFAEEEGGDSEEAEWTVMFYLCGSDLESRQGLASELLKEISGICYTYSVQNTLEYMYEEISFEEFIQRPLFPHEHGVNILVETGGSREWHAQEVGMEVDSGALQRWRYELWDNNPIDEGGSPFILEQSLPLANMADPDTLADFIRWGSESFPAKKYALVLWDHGGGSKSGLFIDELFDRDFMRLDELKEALHRGGTQFEAVLFDACLMANVETACAVADQAKWMVASEELVVGSGTAVGDWLKQLCVSPECSGERLGRIICNLTQRRYANQDNDRAANMMLTWSVIDLSRIEELRVLLNQFFTVYGRAAVTYPIQASFYGICFLSSIRFGEISDHMVDLAGVFYNSLMIEALDIDLRNGILQALDDAVQYCVRGSGRSSAYGLSFCEAFTLTPEELNDYAPNCPFPGYLALLDTANENWNAPDWVYEITERLPKLDNVERYQMRLRKAVSEEGVPGLTEENSLDPIGLIDFNLYGENGKNGQLYYLGSFPVVQRTSEDHTVIWCADDPWIWPAVEGIVCTFKTVSRNETDVGVCNIPILMDNEVWQLRCGCSNDIYNVYGLLEGFDTDSDVSNRNTRSLSQIAGREFRLLYPLVDDGTSETQTYERSEPLIMPRSLDVTNVQLSPGTYYIEFIVYDIFNRPYPLEMVQMLWDGSSVSFGEWSGVIQLK